MEKNRLEAFSDGVVAIIITRNNHHHMFQLCKSIDGSVMWANLHLLFWLSLLPFTTGWMGENHFERWPTVLYGVNLLLCALAFYVLQLMAHQGPQGLLAQAVAKDVKGKSSPPLYVAGIAVAALWSPWAGMAFFVLVALIWLIPDRRIARTHARAQGHEAGDGKRH